MDVQIRKKGNEQDMKSQRMRRCLRTEKEDVAEYRSGPDHDYIGGELLSTSTSYHEIAESKSEIQISSQANWWNTGTKTTRCYRRDEVENASRSWKQSRKPGGASEFDRQGGSRGV